MKLKTMDIQKFLLTGWCPKMAHNVEALAKKGIWNTNVQPLHNAS